VRALATEAGRDPDDVKVLFLISPMVGATEEAAHAKVRAITEAPNYCEKALTLMSAITDIDFSQYALDKELPKLTTNGEQGSLEAFAQWGSGKTLRQLCTEQISRGLTGLIGTPVQVADRMAELMDEVGGDGFLITRPTTTLLNWDYINSICNGLVPELQRRGLTRTAYTKPTLRETLKQF
jgi:alkanesulfonate monooxygenase SsuD/methylene tetrahydromethanopterin reductase-like flavin-dependent oxidoreductase (luciferase family)